MERSFNLVRKVTKQEQERKEGTTIVRDLPESSQAKKEHQQMIFLGCCGIVKAKNLKNFNIKDYFLYLTYKIGVLFKYSFFINYGLIVCV